MFKVLLIDDEPWQVKGLKKMIDWENEGFVVVGSASNALEGIEKIKGLNPDIILVDVQMPQIDGLKMIDIVNSKLGNKNFVIVSGYADFKYAQRAIKMGVLDYLLKPIDEVELKKVLNNLKEKIVKKLMLDENNTKDQHEGLEDMSINKIIKSYNITNIALKKIVIYIGNHYNENLHLNDIARDFFINPAYLGQLFYKGIGMSFSQYILEIRIKKAEYLLLSEDLTIQDVCNKIGIEDYSYFNKLFKKSTGFTPGNYKKNIERVKST